MSPNIKIKEETAPDPSTSGGDALKLGMPPRPQIATGAPAAPPVYQSASSFEDNKTPFIEPEEEVHFDLEEDLDEEGPTRLYQKAKSILIANFGFAIPLVGLVISYMCWKKTKVWKNIFTEHNPNMTNKMVSCATKISFALFVCSCIMIVTCLTGFPMPSSIWTLALITPIISIEIILLAIVIYVLCKFFLDDGFDIYESLLIAVRSTTACFSFAMVNTVILGGVLNSFSIYIFIAITCLAIWSSMNIFHSSPPIGRTIFVAAASGILSGFMMAGLLSLFL